jgi:phosphopantetheinyl transferase
MPLLFQQDINEHSKLAVWEITEELAFFISKVEPARLINHPLRQLQHLAGRYLLSLLVPDALFFEIRYDDGGKPYFENGKLSFSISHSENHVAVIVSEKKQIGIDLQCVTEKALLIKNKFLSEQEFNLLKAVFSDQILAASAGWVIKEACYKWLGHQGLNFIEQIRIEQIEVENGNWLGSCTLFHQNEIKLGFTISIITDYYLLCVAS